jgi:hypothetical protein
MEAQVVDTSLGSPTYYNRDALFTKLLVFGDVTGLVAKLACVCLHVLNYLKIF